MTPVDRHSVPMAPLHALNGRCLELLVHAARTGPLLPLSLPDLLHETLLKSTPDSRRRAAARNFMLLDLEFRNTAWWQAIARAPRRSSPGAPRRSPFARHTALTLTRTTLTVAWQAVQCDLDTACVLFGMEPAVATLIVELPVTALERIAVQGHRYIQPRWIDRPTYWRDLLQAAEREDRVKLRALDAQGLQLLASDRLSHTYPRSQQARPRNTRTGHQATMPIDHPA